YRHHHIEVAGGPTIDPGLALPGQTDAVAVIHARRHLDRQGLGFFHTTLAMAVAAGITDHLPGTMTARTGLLHSEEALLHAHLTMTATGGTGGRLGTLLGTAAVTGIAASRGSILGGHGGV